jgi:cell division protein FtsN
MRVAAVATLVVCIALGACRTTADKPEQSEASAPAAPATDAAPAPQQRRSQSAARGTSPPPAPVPPERDPQYTPEQRTLIIRQVCWAQVDKQRNIRGDDARIAWVNKCIADKRKEPVDEPAAPAAASGPAQR